MKEPKFIYNVAVTEPNYDCLSNITITHLVRVDGVGSVKPGLCVDMSDKNNPSPYTYLEVELNFCAN